MALEIVGDELRIFHFLPWTHWGHAEDLLSFLQDPENSSTLDRSVVEQVREQVNPIIRFDYSVPPYIAFDGTVPEEEFDKAHEFLLRDIIPVKYKDAVRLNLHRQFLMNIPDPQNHPDFLINVMGYIRPPESHFFQAKNLLVKYGGPHQIKRLIGDVMYERALNDALRKTK